MTDGAAMINDPMLRDLRSRFRETAFVRLSEMTSLLGQLSSDSPDVQSIERLARHFHGLAGMGATYGFPLVSSLGDEGEGMILPLVKSGQSPDAGAVKRWQAIVEEMRAELSA
ncbi:MAG: Hpt domain-containing protein [Acidobacteriota bacterium]